MIKVRILQRKDSDDSWFDDAYAVENLEGEISFQYNLTWGRIGAHYNGEIQRQRISLNNIENLITENEGLRWRAIKDIAPDKAKEYLEELNYSCCIPKPRKIKGWSLKAA